MADLEISLADEQARLKELHVAFAQKLDNDWAAHEAKCAELDSELRSRERVAAEKMQLLDQGIEAVKERERAVAEREKKHEEKIVHLRARAETVIREMEEEETARARAARIGA